MRFAIQLAGLFACSDYTHASMGESGNFSPMSRDAYRWEHWEDALDRALSRARANPGMEVVIRDLDTMEQVGLLRLGPL